MTLPAEPAEVTDAGRWGEPHPISGTPLIDGPRNDAELEIVWELLLNSHEYASGA
jgi:hypothetical protein